MMRTKITTVAVLIALGMVAVGSGPPIRQAEADGKSGVKDKMFPDGRDYDFGKVIRGTPVEHTFRIVNRSDVPLELILVLRPGCSAMTAAANKRTIRPTEAGTVEIVRPSIWRCVGAASSVRALSASVRAASSLIAGSVRTTSSEIDVAPVRAAP